MRQADIWVFDGNMCRLIDVRAKQAFVGITRRVFRNLVVLLLKREGLLVPVRLLQPRMRLEPWRLDLGTLRKGRNGPWACGEVAQERDHLAEIGCNLLLLAFGSDL